MFVHLISVSFGFYLFFNTKRLFIRFKLDLHTQFKFYSFSRFIYSFTLVHVVCLFAMIVYLISVRFGLGFTYSLIVISV